MTAATMIPPDYVCPVCGETYHGKPAAPFICKGGLEGPHAPAAMIPCPDYSTSNNAPDDPDATPIPAQDTAVANIIPAGQTVMLFRRWVYDHGPDECLGTFRATRTFSPSVEHAQFCRDFPDYGPPSTWTANDRADWVRWACDVAGFIEPFMPSYVFMEPWPEKPMTSQTAAAEKVAHEDR